MLGKGDPTFVEAVHVQLTDEGRYIGMFEILPARS